MKKIAVGDLGEFWYADYKEPLTAFEGGYGYVGAILKDDAGRLLCNYCGKTFDNLGRHVSATHGMSSRDYKNEVGLLQKSALVSEKGRQTRMRTALATYRSGKTGRPEQLELARSNVVVRHSGKKNPAWTAEYLNKTGRCYEQTLAVARTIASNGHRVTQKTMGRYGIRDLTVISYFGSWENLRRLVGAKARLHHKWSDEELVSAFRSLAHELGRTPRQSDLNRYGLPAATFSRRFSHDTLCQRAGIPTNLPVPMDEDREVQVLSAYSIIGDVSKVAEKLGMAHKTVTAVFARYGCPYSGYGRSASLRREWAADMAQRLAAVSGTATEAIYDARVANQEEAA